MAGMFGNILGGRPPYGTPPIYDPTEGMEVGGIRVGPNVPGMFGNMTQTPAGKPKFFGEGGTGRSIAGAIGDYLLQSSGMRPVYAPMVAQRRQDAREDARLQLLADKAERAARRRQIQNLGNGGIASVDPESGQVEVIRQPDAPQPGEQERLIQQWSQLPEGDPRKPLIERAIRGYQYTAPVMDARQQQQEALIDRRANLGLRNKQAPTFAQTHPSGGSGGGAKRLTATARAKYISEAQSAISRGADPAKVKARLREMGVQ